MIHRARLVLFGAGAAAVAALFGLSIRDMPSFGGAEHIYRDLAIRASLLHQTPNAVSSVNFDQRAIDTLGEETILLASIFGVMALLRPATEERELLPRPRGHALDATRLVGYLMLPLTLVIGVSVVAHGHISPGGGFQGGVLIATAIHLLYVTGSFRALNRLRPVNAFDAGEIAGAAGFLVLGLCGIVFGSVFLANVLPKGQFGSLFSGGLVPLFNVVVGIEVACGMTVLLAQFLAQEITIVKRGERP